MTFETPQLATTAKKEVYNPYARETDPPITVCVCVCVRGADGRRDDSWRGRVGQQC